MYFLYLRIIETMGKAIKKIQKVLSIATLTLIGVCILLFILTLLPPIQRWSCEKLTYKLSSTLGVKVTADRLRYFPFTTVGLLGINICDKQGDTLLTAKSIKADIALNSLWSTNLSLSDLTLDGVSITACKRENGLYNFNDIELTSDSSSTVNLNIKSVSLHDCKLLVVAQKQNKVFISDIDTHIRDIVVSDSLISARVSYVSAFDELSRRNISLSAQTSVRGDTISADDIKGYYGNTIVDIPEVHVICDSTHEFSNIYADIEKLYVDDKLITLFVPTWHDISVNIKGQSRITTSAIDFSGLELTTSGKSMLNSDVHIKNYSQRDKFIVDADISHGIVNLSELELMTGRQLADKSNADMVGNIEFAGNINGSSNNMIYKGHMISNIGIVNIDGNAIMTNERITVNSRLYSKGMDFSLISDGLIGPLAFDSEINGFIERDSSLFAQIDGNVEHITLKGYRYNKIYFNGFTNKRQGNVLVEMHDPNGNINIIGEYNDDKNGKYFALTAKVDSLKTGKTNLTPDYPLGILSFASRLSVTQQNSNVRHGNIFISKLRFSGADNDVKVDKLIANVNHNGSKKDIFIESDLFNGVVNGNFAYSDVWPALYNQSLGSANILGHPIPLSDEVLLNANLTYDDISPILQFFTDSLLLNGQGEFRCSIDSKHKTSQAFFKSNKINYRDYEASDIVVHANSNADSTSMNVSSSHFIAPLLGSVVNADISNNITDNCIKSQLTWFKESDKQLKTDIKLNTCLTKDHYGLLANIDIVPSEIIFEENTWNIQKSQVSISTHSLNVDNFKIESGEKFLNIDGSIDTKLIEDTLTLTVNKFVVEDIIKTNPKTDRFTIAGDLCSTAKITDYEESYIVNCTADINRFFVNGDYLERLDVETNWSSERNRLDLNLAIYTDKKCRAHGIGGYDIKNNDFNVYFDIDSLSIGFLNHYLNSPIKHISGTTSGDLRLAGVMPDIKLDARLMLNKSPFSVRQTAVDYHFLGGDSIILAPDDMEFRNLRFVDKHGNQGEFYGHIRHNMFRGLKLDLYFLTKDMLILESTEAESPTYYGTVFADGLLAVTGTTSNVELLINATTRPNTIFNILPLGKGDMHENTYIKFTTPSKNGNKGIIVDYDAITSSVTAELNVKIEPTAQICVIVNPRTNNMIKATGSGDLQLTINKSGDLNIFGDYIIENGMYNFSFENLLNKQFIINRGSSLSWDGAPYNARIDLIAKYSTKASLYDLVAGNGDATNSDIKRRVPVNVNIQLSERLADPNIKFNIDIPSSLNFNQYTFDQYVNSEEEMNRQAISLLLSNRFSVVQENAGQSQNNTSGYVTTTLSELVSNQISNWISQNKYNLNLGVNYRPGDEVTNEEYGVALSTQILNNKIVLSGNIGYGRNLTKSSDGSVIGDFDIEYKINKSGNLRAKAYTHSNNDVIYETSPTTQGIGISFSEEFNTFGELMRKYWGIISGKRKREKAIEQDNK